MKTLPAYNKLIPWMQQAATAGVRQRTDAPWYMFQKDGSDCSVETQLQVAKDDRLVGRLPQKLKLQRPVTGLILFSSACCLSLSPCKTTACAVHCLLPHPVGFSRCQEPAPEKE